MADGVWAYLVARSAVDFDNLRGVAEEPLRRLPVGDLVAVVGSVPLETFGEEGLKKNLEDLDWLAVTARRHDSVIRQLSGPVVPFRFATVYSDDDSARSAVAERADEFAAALEFVSGRTEIGVTGFAIRPPEEKSPAEKVSGRDYLLRRKHELQQQEWSAQESVQSAKLVHEQLLEMAVAGQSNRPHDQKLTHGEPMVHNGTYLVENAQIAAFEQRVTECGEQFPNLRLQVNGHWPPYSFVSS